MSLRGLIHEGRGLLQEGGWLPVGNGPWEKLNYKYSEEYRVRVKHKQHGGTRERLEARLRYRPEGMGGQPPRKVNAAWVLSVDKGPKKLHAEAWAIDKENWQRAIARAEKFLASKKYTLLAVEGDFQGQPAPTKFEQTTTANVGAYEQPFGPPLAPAYPPLLRPDDESEDDWDDDEELEPKRKRLRLRKRVHAVG